MAVVVGTNSWATIAEADAYLGSRAGSTAWFELPDTPPTPGQDSKETFLATAFFWLLDYPGFSLTADSTAAAVKRAQLEAALFLLQFRADYEARAAKIAGGVKQISMSKWSETLGEQALPKRILAILSVSGIDGNANILVDLEPNP
jgi:hypothetical protein